MKYKNQYTLLIMLLFSLSISAHAQANANLAHQLTNAQSSWMTKSTVEISATGTVETVLPPELHRIISNSKKLDLKLVGPDNNSRSFELFRKEIGEEVQVGLRPEKVKLLSDNRILWEANVPKNFIFNKIITLLSDNSYVGKVTCEVLNDNTWSNIESDIAVMKQGAYGKAEIKFGEMSFSKIRLYFSGFDSEFKQTPIFVNSVSIQGKRNGLDYHTISNNIEFEEIWRKRILEVRIKLPGSGLHIRNLAIKTKALFNGEWSIGRERISLGKRSFIKSQSDRIASVRSNPKIINIYIDRQWTDRILILHLDAENYFGGIESVNCTMELPRMVFLADEIGKYTIQTGSNKPVETLETAGNFNRIVNIGATFSTIETNSNWQAEVLLKDYSLKGGPFSDIDFQWKAPIRIQKAGFYQLQLDAHTCLNNELYGLRIVKDNVQVPYFTGEKELREFPLDINSEYEQSTNKSTYSIKLPNNSRSLIGLTLTSQGMFSRHLVFEKHVSGMVGWQRWQTILWENKTSDETQVRVNLRNFPNDQKDIRFTITNGSNQPIVISKISASYSSQNMYFVATNPGHYFLYGGNSKAHPARYDLALIQNKLLNLFPQKIKHGKTIHLKQTGTITPLAQEKGATFNSSGYNWMATFTVEIKGLSQLALDQTASLDENINGIRIVKNGNQIPYFNGQAKLSSLSLDIKKEYSKDKNTTTLHIALPMTSSKWRSIKLVSSGVFNRTIVTKLKKPGNLGWKEWKKNNWVGQNQNDTSFNIALNNLPKGETDLQVVIEHGDNSPITIKKAGAYYLTHDLFFHANETGNYQIFGGNDNAKAPSYDISIIKNQLLKAEPNKLSMGKVVSHSSTNIKKQLQKAFSEKGMGLYVIFALITLALLVMIVKLFPDDVENKEENQEPK